MKTFGRIKDAEPVRKKLYHILVFNNEDTDYALYVRNDTEDAQLLAAQMAEYEQVRAVQINEVVTTEKPIWEVSD